MKKLTNTLRHCRWRLTRVLKRKALASGVFVLGTGRSGTHFLTRCLISHPDLTDLMSGRENPFVFKDVVNIALNNGRDPQKITGLIDKYRFLMQVAAPKGLVDQSHPNIWIADAIARQIDGAKFIGIIRDPFSVTYSTLQHSGVRNRFGKWQAYPTPNPFLGIDAHNREAYDRLTLPEQSALRWISHAKRLGDLKAVLGERLLIVQYEDLCLHGDAVMRRIAAFLGVAERFVMPRVMTDSLYKKNLLSPDDILGVCRSVTDFTGRHALEPQIETMVGQYLAQSKGGGDAA